MLPFWNYIREHKRILFWALLLGTISQIFSLLDPQIFRLIIDNYATKSGEISRDVFIKGVILLLLAFVGVAFISRVTKTFQDYFVSFITQKVGTSIYARSVGHTFSLPYHIFEDRKSGEVLSKLQKAKNDSQTLIEDMINIIFLSLVGILFVVGYAFTVHWLIGVSYFMLIPIVGISTFVLSRRIKEAQKNIVIQTAELAGSTTETLRNVELVKSLGLEHQEISRLNEVNEKILELELRKIKEIRKLSFIQGTIINAMRAVLVFIMMWLISTDVMTVGEFFSLFVYSFFIFTPLSNLGTIAAHYREAKASNEQLDEILKIEIEKIPPNPVVIENIENIEYKDVYFSYPTDDNASISKINFNIQKGETIALVGPSGSGKSTLIKLLVGLYSPNKGNLMFNGIDSKKIDYKHLRSKIGLVSQETQLFAGTLRENLLFVNPKASDKECIDSLKLASVDHLLKRGEKGLDNKIGEGGIKLSGGEKQRLAIARALLRNPQLLLFDEATSSLDSLTEKEITKTIKKISEIRKNLICIIVAHRLSTISHAGQIYVLSKGRIIEKGSHEKLVKSNGLYSALWKEQNQNNLEKR